MKYNLKRRRSALAIFLIVFFLIAMNILKISAISYENNDTDADIYHKKDNAYKKIALTFDDGPHPRYTPQILEILSKYNIKATFFTVGVNAKNYPDTLEKVISAGHEVENHTYTHPHVNSVDFATLKREIECCESEIYEHTDYKTKFFRPPEGMIDDEIIEMIKSLDYKIVLWDIDTRDWAHTPPQKIAENIIDNINSGDIILMHDYIGHNSPTPEALKIFLPILIDRGYNFVTVSELIGLN